MNTGPVTPAKVADMIRAGLPGATVQVESDDNTHFASRIVATQFAGLRPIARHQLVYQTLGALVGREIHALSIEALTPDELAARGR
jgi:acid stress-induced BolA-like protein IbaG/YrbA